MLYSLENLGETETTHRVKLILAIAIIILDLVVLVHFQGAFRLDHTTVMSCTRKIKPIDFFCSIYSLTDEPQFPLYYDTLEVEKVLT